MSGLATDVLTLYAHDISHVLSAYPFDKSSRRERFRFRVNMYTIKEEREIEPETFAHLVSSTLYERR